MTTFITNSFETFQNFKLEDLSQKVFHGTYKDFASKYPTVNKVIIFANHLLRLVPMIALMQVLPFTVTTNCALMVGGALFYRVTIERLCPLRFALLSCFGAIAFDFMRLNTLGAFSFVPLAVYGVSVIYTSMTSNEGAVKTSCCK